MTRLRHVAKPPPRLVEVYATTTGSGTDVHAEYVRRWLAWHAEVCGRWDCLRHVDRHGRATPW